MPPVRPVAERPPGPRRRPPADVPPGYRAPARAGSEDKQQSLTLRPPPVPRVSAWRVHASTATDRDWLRVDRPGASPPEMLRCSRQPRAAAVRERVARVSDVFR